MSNNQNSNKQVPPLNVSDNVVYKSPEDVSTLQRTNTPVPEGKTPTYIHAMGGIGEIGKSMYVIEHGDEIVIVDAGIKFATEDLLGINTIIPSFKWLKERENRIQGIFITHGHEDHIGGVPFLLKEVKVPKVYASRLASELIKKKMAEHSGLNPHEHVVFNDNWSIKFKHIEVEVFRVHHSIPDSFGVSVSTSNGRVVNCGDYRFDFTPMGDLTDLHKISEIAKKGVTIFLGESTNAEREGFSSSERKILSVVKNIFMKSTGRIILSTFASNLGRIEEIVALASNIGRRICILGRSMDANLTISRKIGYLQISDDAIIDVKNLNEYPDNEILILSTGSQGEEMAALNVMARGKHAWVNLKPTDTIIMSSNPIPGNVGSVERMINQLYKSGVKVLQNSPNLVLHASGHASKQEQQLMMSLLDPAYLVPIHGEYRHLLAQRKSAIEIGIPEERIFILGNGERLRMLDEVVTIEEDRIEIEDVYIDDSSDITHANGVILKDRRSLSEEGMIVCSVLVDLKAKELLNNPSIVTRGTFNAKDSTDFLFKLKGRIRWLVKEEFEKDYFNINDIKMSIKRNISSMVWKEKHKNPLVVVLLNRRDLQKQDASKKEVQQQSN